MKSGKFQLQDISSVPKFYMRVPFCTASEEPPKENALVVDAMTSSIDLINRCCIRSIFEHLVFPRGSRFTHTVSKHAPPQCDRSEPERGPPEMAEGQDLPGRRRRRDRPDRPDRRQTETATVARPLKRLLLMNSIIVRSLIADTWATLMLATAGRRLVGRRF